jgi:hypothetical protein
MKSLRERFKEIEDDRAWHEYPLDGLLTLMSLAMMCGCNHIREIERWGKTYRWELSERLGFRRNRMPCEKQFRDILKRLDTEAFTRIVTEWGEATLQALGEEGLVALAIDGKTVRGSRRADLPAVHLLSALGHEVQVVLGQVEVESHTNEIKGIVPLLADLTLEGRVITMDALLTQRDIAETIIEKGGTT